MSLIESDARSLQNATKPKELSRIPLRTSAVLISSSSRKIWDEKTRIPRARSALCSPLARPAPSVNNDVRTDDFDEKSVNFDYGNETTWPTIDDNDEYESFSTPRKQLQDDSSKKKDVFSGRTMKDQLPQKKGKEIQTILSPEPISPAEKAYYEKCKRYSRLSQMPIVQVSDNIFENDITLASTSLKFSIDEDYNEFDEEKFLNEICKVLNINRIDIDIKKIQTGCIVWEAEIFKNIGSKLKKIKIKELYNSLTDKIKEELSKLKIFFMFLGDIVSLNSKQKFREEILLNTQWNRIYDKGHTYWNGALKDDRNRGNHPYFCPVGWRRYSFYVTDNFDDRFDGWCVCYHGTKFSYGLSILLSGLAPAKAAQHGAGIYVTPSVIYATHPRYSEVKEIASPDEKTCFKNGSYVQFVLQCRVHPKSIKKIACETLETSSPIIDSNINNDSIEWVIDANDQCIVDFNDPNSTIVCTGLMLRVTDNHPGLLPESEWWFTSHLCPLKGNQHCLTGIGLDELKKQKDNGVQCTIIYE